MPTEIFEETTTISWTGRLRESAVGVGVGALMMVLAVVLLWWNEGVAQKSGASLAEGAAKVVTASPDVVDPANDGKLVYVTGTARANETLRDTDYKMSADGLVLIRTVEMLQWTEKQETEAESNVGGSQTRRTRYTYETAWSETPVDSTKFNRPDGHVNPKAFLVQGRKFVANRAKLGAYTLAPALVEQIPVSQPLDPPAPGDGQSVADGWLYLSGNATTPMAGEVRVGFKVVPQQAISVVAEQSGGGLRPFDALGGDVIALVGAGEQPPAALFATAKAGNELFAWMFRLVGWIFLVVGLALIGRPLVVVADVVPAIGNILRLGVLLFALAVGTALALAVIALAWMAARPALALGLAVVALAIVLLAHRRGGMVAVKRPVVVRRVAL